MQKYVTILCSLFFSSCITQKATIKADVKTPRQVVAYANKIAITLDDLPGAQDESAEKLQEINDRILTALNKFNAPAVGFVNEYKLYIKKQTIEKTAILKSWIDHGQEDIPNLVEIKRVAPPWYKPRSNNKGAHSNEKRHYQ